MKNGLKPIKRDIRDRSFHRTFGGITPITLPQEFTVDAGLTMPNQTADGLYEACTAYTQQELKTDLDSLLSDKYREHYEKTLQLEGAPFGSGCDIRDSLKILIDFYGVGAYYAVESSKMDWFDSICSVMYTNFVQNKIKCAVSIGTPWFKEWDVLDIDKTGIVPKIFNGDISAPSWHNWAIKGWKVINNEPYILAKTWQGTGYGDTGWAYYPREAINAVMKINGTGAFTIAPRNPDNVQTVKRTMLESLIRFLQQLFNLNQQTMPPINSPLIPKPPVPSVLLWDNPVNCRHSVRVMCDNAGLSHYDKEVITACIKQESNFNPKAVGTPNSNGTIDYGICQFNDGHNANGVPLWIGPGARFASIDEVLNNPEKCVAEMIAQYKLGHIIWWSSYSTKAYLKFMP